MIENNVLTFRIDKDNDDTLRDLNHGLKGYEDRALFIRDRKGRWFLRLNGVRHSLDIGKVYTFNLMTN